MFIYSVALKCYYLFNCSISFFHHFSFQKSSIYSIHIILMSIIFHHHSIAPLIKSIEHFQFELLIKALFVSCDVFFLKSRKIVFIYHLKSNFFLNWSQKLSKNTENVHNKFSLKKMQEAKRRRSCPFDENSLFLCIFYKLIFEYIWQFSSND